MKKIVLFSCFALFASSLSAQTNNLKNGYVITNKRDTVWGRVDLRTNKINQQQCRFIAGNQQAAIYKPSEIAGYFFIDEGKYYVTKTLEIDSANRTVFAEMPVKGMLNLYY